MFFRMLCYCSIFWFFYITVAYARPANFERLYEGRVYKSVFDDYDEDKTGYLVQAKKCETYEWKDFSNLYAWMQWIKRNWISGGVPFPEDSQILFKLAISFDDGNVDRLNANSLNGLAKAFVKKYFSKGSANHFWLFGTNKCVFGYCSYNEDSVGKIQNLRLTVQNLYGVTGSLSLMSIMPFYAVSKLIIVERMIRPVNIADYETARGKKILPYHQWRHITPNENLHSENPDREMYQRTYAFRYLGEQFLYSQGQIIPPLSSGVKLLDELSDYKSFLCIRNDGMFVTNRYLHTITTGLLIKELVSELRNLADSR